MKTQKHNFVHYLLCLYQDLMIEDFPQLLNQMALQHCSNPSKFAAKLRRHVSKRRMVFGISGNNLEKKAE